MNMLKFEDDFFSSKIFCPYLSILSSASLLDNPDLLVFNRFNIPSKS